MTIKGKKHISLKEAAELSGYTPDYIGQLIRGGKLPGKKVYANVAWMTTEEDLREYIRGSNGNGSGNGNGHKKALNGNGSGSGNGNGRAGDRFGLLPSRMAKPALFFAAGFLGAAVFALFYILAVNFDSRLEERAIEQVQTQSDVSLVAPVEASTGEAINGLPRL